MSKINNLKRRLRTDPDGMLGWMDGGYLPQVSYESAEITGIQLSLMLEGHEDVYILSILPEMSMAVTMPGSAGWAATTWCICSPNGPVTRRTWS